MGVKVWGFTGEYRRRFTLYSNVAFDKGGRDSILTALDAHARLSFPPPLLLRGAVCGRAPFSKAFFAYEIYFCCRRAAATLPSHVTFKPAEEE